MSSSLKQWAAAVGPLALQAALFAGSKMFSAREDDAGATTSYSLLGAPAAAPERLQFTDETQGGRVVASSLRAHGVRMLFTLPGLNIAPINVAANDLGIKVVDVRGEATAVFAAEAHFRLTGVPGVATITAGPGITTATAGVANARASRSAVVLLGGAPPGWADGYGPVQAFPDAAEALRPLCKSLEWVRSAAEIAPAMAKAFSEAASGVPGPVVLMFPKEVLYSLSELRKDAASLFPGGLEGASATRRTKLDHYAERVFSVVGKEVAIATPQPVTLPLPSASFVTEAAKLVTAASRPVLIVGPDVSIVHPANTTRLVDVKNAISQIGIPVQLSGSSRGLLGRNNPLELHLAAKRALDSADLVILAGVSLNQRLSFGTWLAPGAKLISASRCPEDNRINSSVEGHYAISCLSDPSSFILELAKAIDSANDLGSWKAAIIAMEREANKILEKFASVPCSQPSEINPFGFCRTFSELFANTQSAPIIVYDGGEFAKSVSETVVISEPSSWIDAGPYHTLGCGAGYALCAGLLHQDRDIWLIWGDGACGYGLSELDTLSRNGVHVVAVVGNNASWEMIENPQVVSLGNAIGCQLVRNEYHGVANALGASGKVIAASSELDLKAELVSAAQEAKVKGHPILLNVTLGKSAGSL